jgi:hypothetical protein
VASSIPHRAQTLAVDWLSRWTLGEIETLFSSHELPSPVETLDDGRSAVVRISVRRDLAARYNAGIDTQDACCGCMTRSSERGRPPPADPRRCSAHYAPMVSGSSTTG